MSGQRIQHHQQPQQPQQQSGVPHTHNPAAQAVQYACRLLRSHGVLHLTPELLRQAKFNAPASAQPLLLALHDLAVLQLAGFPPNSAEALHKLRRQLQQEALLLDAAPALPPPGRLLLLHCLSEWGCPAGLVAQLTLQQPSSRSALLALCWLIDHTQLFDRAQQQLQLPAHLLSMLPPYPEDTCLTAEAQGPAQAAVSACKHHHQRVQQLLQQQQQAIAPAGAAGKGPDSSSGSSGGSWLVVQTAAQHVLSTYRAATLQLQQLTCLVEAREKLLHELRQEQQQQQKAAPVLTAFELHLLANPQLLQQHREALAQAVGLLQQQQECQQHAEVFFAWAASVVAQAQQQQQQQDTDAVGGSNGGVAGGRQQAHAKTPTAQRQQMLPVPCMQELLPLVQQLPQANSQLAVGVLTRVYKQLQQAAFEAGIPSSSSSSSSSSSRNIHSNVQQPQALDDVRSSAAAADTANQLAAAVEGGCSLGSSTHELMQSEASGQSMTGAAAFEQAAVAALLRADTVPQACIQQLQQLPQDLQDALRQQQERTASEHSAQQPTGCCHARRVLVQPPTHRQQQQSGTSLSSSNAHRHGSPPAADVTAGVGVVAAGDELQRLTGAALQVAKQLAKTRAANKQQLSLAAQALLDSGTGPQGQQLVLYQS